MLLNPLKTIPWLNYCSCLIAGICLGLGLCYGLRGHFTRGPQAPGITQLDDNEDGRVDAEITYSNGVAIMLSRDRNFDGKWDYWEWYDQAGRVSRSECDDNFDGLVDGWVSYRFNRPLYSKHDLDANGIADVAVLYFDGLPAALLSRPNGRTNYMRVQLFEHGIVREEYSDASGSGLLDTVILYDAFGFSARSRTFSPGLDPHKVLEMRMAQHLWGLLSR